MAEPFRFDRNYTPFTCAICEERQRADEHYFISVRDAPIPPVCRHCEEVWAQSKVRVGGSHRDRRLTMQISAIAEKLASLSYRKLHGGLWE